MVRYSKSENRPRTSDETRAFGCSSLSANCCVSRRQRLAFEAKQIPYGWPDSVEQRPDSRLYECSARTLDIGLAHRTVRPRRTERNLVHNDGSRNYRLRVL